jgi:urea transport system substrate-binding protein
MAAAAALLPCMALGQEEPIKVGVLHSLSGTMAISETTFADDLIVMHRGQVVVAGAKHDVDEGKIRGYLTV